MFALAACDSDSTPIVPMAATGGGSPSAGEAVSCRDSNKLGPNDRLRITVFGQPTLTGEYTLDGNGVLAFPLIGNVPANASPTSELQQKIAAKLNPDYLINPMSAPKSSPGARRVKKLKCREASAGIAVPSAVR